VFIECIELINQFLIVVKAQKLLHLLDLLNLSLLPSYLLLHFTHHSLVAGDLSLQVSYLRVVRFSGRWFFIIFSDDRRVIGGKVGGVGVVAKLREASF
jgi:hypothetical protein